MTITKEMNGTELKIALEGRLDTVTAPELEAELNQSLGNAESLTMDFSKTGIHLFSRPACAAVCP